VAGEHELKCWPEAFVSVCAGTKTAEFRRDDRGFEAGDILVLREWEPASSNYTGRAVRKTISHITRGPRWGLPDGFAMLSLARGGVLVLPDVPLRYMPRCQPIGEVPHAG
jgi:hypothetical protein